MIQRKKKINSCLRKKYYYLYREWPYKKVEPRIIAEEYMEDSATKELRDYKFFCFNGLPKILFVATERFGKDGEVKFDFFDVNYKHLPIINGHPNSIEPPSKPSKFDEMIHFSKLLSKNIPFVRCDFYEVNGHVYFGEYTFYHFSGLVPFEPKEWDELLGSWIDLPPKKK